jgi:hypothetical protein
MSADMSANMSGAVFIEAIGIAAPGLVGWQSAAPILRGEQPYVAAELPPHAPPLLPPNERRRASPTVRLAFQAAEDAMQSSSIAASELATVFASSDADLNIIHRICSALTVTPRMISPTDFHNSVHNAAAGYWSIAVGSRAPSSTISAHDYSFAVGLAEAWGCVQVDGCDTLLVAFDLPPPAPLYEKRPIEQPAAIALVLTQRRTSNTVGSLHCEWVQTAPTACASEPLERLRQNNPAARGLPLLALIAQGKEGSVVLPLGENAGLAIEFRMV